MIDFLIHLPAWFALTVSMASLAYTIISGRSRAAKAEVMQDRNRADDRHNALWERTIAVEQRVAHLETEVPHLPDKDSFHRVEIAIERLEGKLSAMDERLKPVLASVNRVQDHLMDGKR